MSDTVLDIEAAKEKIKTKDKIQSFFLRNTITGEREITE